MTFVNHSASPLARQRGFTLIELMVTLFLGAILVGVAVPAFKGVIATNRLVTQTNELVGAMTIARSEAITRNLRMTFCRAADASTTSCAGSAANWGFWIVVNPSGSVVRRGTINTYNNNLKVTSTFTGDTMNYTSDGLGRDGSSATLLTSSKTVQVCVTTTPKENFRTVTPGIASQLTTAKTTGTC